MAHSVNYSTLPDLCQGACVQGCIHTFKKSAVLPTQLHMKRADVEEINTVLMAITTIILWLQCIIL